MNCQTQTGAVPDHEIGITDAAISAFGLLFRSIGSAFSTHAAGDGGLICEDRTVRARPLIWRISPEGALVPDSRYDFAARGFIASAFPGDATRG